MRSSSCSNCPLGGSVEALATGPYPPAHPSTLQPDPRRPLFRTTGRANARRGERGAETILVDERHDASRVPVVLPARVVSRVPRHVGRHLRRQGLPLPADSVLHTSPLDTVPGGTEPQNFVLQTRVEPGQSGTTAHGTHGRRLCHTPTRPESLTRAGPSLRSGVGPRPPGDFQ